VYTENNVKSRGNGEPFLLNQNNLKQKQSLSCRIFSPKEVINFLSLTYVVGEDQEKHWETREGVATGDQTMSGSWELES